VTINRAALGIEDKPDDAAKRIAKELLKGKTREELLQFAGVFLKQESESGKTKSSDIPEAPKTPDELWNYIYETWHVAIPRVAVCEDHDAPFDFVCAGFFNWYPNIFEISSRGAGKSFKRALGHALNARFKPGSESATFGAVEEQAKRVYAAFKTFVDRDEIVGEPKISETNYRPVPGMPYGSKVEILGGTVAAVNGPHPQFPHSDEVELMRADTWRESRNLASDRITPDGRRIEGQNSATSTMKWKGGRVWQILEQFLAAKKKAIERYGDDEEARDLVNDMITKTAPFYVFISCLFENSAQVPNCRSAPENAHLPQWEPGLDKSLCKCDCDEIVNGVLEIQDDNGNPLPRTLESECQGRFYRSRGHRSRGEVIQLFMQNDQRTWLAQQLCRETESEGLYLPNFSRNRHGLARFPFNIANGPVYTGTDWGFVDPAAVVWIQYLERAVEAIRYDGTKIVVPRGARVVLSELTITQKTATELGHLVITQEIKLATVLSVNRVEVRKRWADLQGAGDRRDWAKMGLKTARYSTRDFGEHVKEFRGLVDADRFFVVIDEDRFTGMGCPALSDQIEGWREEDGKESRELPQHVVSATRYCLYGLHDIYMDSGAQSPEQMEIQKLMVGGGMASAPAAKSFPNPVVAADLSALRAEVDWRSRI
jgi:hypothetical protein